jgi:hypothetical protein
MAVLLGSSKSSCTRLYTPVPRHLAPSHDGARDAFQLFQSCYSNLGRKNEKTDTPDVFFRCREYVSVNDDLAARLNNDAHSAAVDRGALEAALREQGEDFRRHVLEQCPHLFAAAPYFVTQAQMAQMHAVIAAIEHVVALPAYRSAVLRAAPQSAPRALGVCMGYDFHLNDTGAHLIEINTNAGGAWLNALLLRSQRDVALPGAPAAADDLDLVLFDMFRSEWRLERGDAPLRTVAIVDEQPERQYLYPEFLLAQRMFERAGIAALIADPLQLHVQGDGVYCEGRKVDLIYNRLTDFTLAQYPALSAAYLGSLAVVTPHPQAYALYADKHNLALLSDAETLRGFGLAREEVAVLLTGIPQTRLVNAQAAEQWWQERKQWFFKPASGYGSKGAYRGDKVTQRVFAEIMQADYVAQRMAPPGERRVNADGDEPVALKSDVRCYVYDGKLQFVAARLYRGQTTNFRTPGGGFAAVRVVG